MRLIPPLSPDLNFKATFLADYLTCVTKPETCQVGNKFLKTSWLNREVR